MKINPKAMLGFIVAGISGIVAFISSIADQKQQNLIDSMEKRISLLEENSNK